MRAPFVASELAPASVGARAARGACHVGSLDVSDGSETGDAMGSGAIGLAGIAGATGATGPGAGAGTGAGGTTVAVGAAGVADV